MADTDPDPRRYGRSFADVYDEWYADVPTGELVAFVEARVGAGGTVLELGVGTGRVALALAAAGFAMTGLDSSVEMLDLMRAKAGATAIVAIEGDAADAACYPVGTQRVVLAVFNLLFNLTGPDQQSRCLAAAAGALTDDGIVVVEAFVPAPVDERRRDLVTRSVEPGRVVLIATDADPGSGLVNGSHIEITDGGTRLRPWAIRVADHHELDRLANGAGLRLAERFEDFGGRPFVEGESTHHVSVYRRA